MSSGKHYFAIYKPYGMLSQFTREAPHHRVLGDLYDFPKDVYPLGRLDQDSEGLLLLTNDKRLNQALLHPSRGHRRTYWVQVEGLPTATALERLRRGVTIRIKKKAHHCLPMVVEEIPPPPLPDRDPPVRFRKSVPTTWLSLSLTEGKNRQVRRMCAAVGCPVLRLVRYAIEDLTLEDMSSASVKSLAVGILKKQLKLIF
ncbi:MAG: pseudouridine synthase [Bacteroidota bacterium]